MFTIMNGDLALINGFGQVWLFRTEADALRRIAEDGLTGTPRECRVDDSGAAVVGVVRQLGSSLFGVYETEYHSTPLTALFTSREDAEAWLTAAERSATPGTAEHTDDTMDTCTYCGESFLHWQKDAHQTACEASAAKQDGAWAIFTGGYRVQWLPTFDTEAEALERMHRIGENGGWDERTEVQRIA